MGIIIEIENCDNPNHWVKKCFGVWNWMTDKKMPRLNSCELGRGMHGVGSVTKLKA
jgi:hypothetical protein